MLANNLCPGTDEAPNYAQVIKPTCEAFQEWNPSAAHVQYPQPQQFQFLFPPQTEWPYPAHLQHTLQQQTMIQPHEMKVRFSHF
uniref:Gamma-gliadin n=1 Tax=Heterorhabditis bacteriophora TaxID=37862 RepID=A0A1I7W7P9_HETBA